MGEGMKVWSRWYVKSEGSLELYKYVCKISWYSCSL